MCIIFLEQSITIMSILTAVRKAISILELALASRARSVSVPIKKTRLERVGEKTKDFSC